MATTVEEYAAQPHAARLRRLARTADELAKAVAGRSGGELAQRPASDAWAAVEVLCHLRDAEEWFLVRCQLALAMDEPAFPRNSPDRWASERQYLRCDAAAALLAFRRRREEVLTLFDGLTEAQWRRGGVHLDSRGRRSLDEFLSVMAWHDDNHRDQLLRALDGRA